MLQRQNLNDFLNEDYEQLFFNNFIIFTILYFFKPHQKYINVRKILSDKMNEWICIIAEK